VEALDNKCPACGAKITFNPKNQMWDCEYCGSKFTLEEMQKHKNASTKEANDNQVKENINLDLYRCKNCGAEIIADETTTATFCVYCGSTAILKEKITTSRVPDFIIPFKNVKEDAKEAFKKVTKGKPLMPKAFKSQSNIEKMKGVYIPFWAFDINCTGDCNFHCTDIKTWSDSKYRYTKTDTYNTVIKETSNFEKVLADASSRFDDDLMDSVEPFNFEGLETYNHAYLSGFYAEKYDVEEAESNKRANERTMNTCIDLAKEKIHHQSVKLQKNNLVLSTAKTNYIMLPVWMVNVKYNDKIYTFAMNGQTGKIVGNIPIDTKKVIIYSVLFFLLFFLVAFIFCYMVV
jgi:DNA-directed RNA polymerase subunit RPC12/RpoP